MKNGMYMNMIYMATLSIINQMVMNGGWNMTKKDILHIKYGCIHECDN